MKVFTVMFVLAVFGLSIFGVGLVVVLNSSNEFNQQFICYDKSGTITKQVDDVSWIDISSNSVGIKYNYKNGYGIYNPTYGEDCRISRNSNQLNSVE